MKVLFAGSGEFGLPALKAICAGGHEVALVVSQPDRPAGRGRKTVATPISRYTEEVGLPLLRTENINSETLPACDVMVVIAFGQKISSTAANAPRLGSMNLHASLLPKCRGAAPINWTILRGESVTGNSIIRLAEKMDAGAVLAQSRVEIGEMETAGELHDRLAEDGAGLVLEAMAGLEAGSIREVEQDQVAATLAPKLSRGDAMLDFGKLGAEELSRRIRGLYPWPGCRVRSLDAAGKEQTRLTLCRVKVVKGEGPRWNAGDITAAGQISVGDGSKALEIVELQPEGRTPMTLSAYRNGHPWMPGMHLESIA